jgi:hypothetical protein
MFKLLPVIILGWDEGIARVMKYINCSKTASMLFFLSG